MDYITCRLLSYKSNVVPCLGLYTEKHTRGFSLNSDLFHSPVCFTLDCCDGFNIPTSSYISNNTRACRSSLAKSISAVRVRDNTGTRGHGYRCPCAGDTRLFSHPLTLPGAWQPQPALESTAIRLWIGKGSPRGCEMPGTWYHRAAPRWLRRHSHRGNTATVVPWCTLPLVLLTMPEAKCRWL